MENYITEPSNVKIFMVRFIAVKNGYDMYVLIKHVMSISNETLNKVFVFIHLKNQDKFKYE